MQPSAPTTHACAGCGAPFVPTLVGQTLCDRCQGLQPPEPASSPLQEADVSGYRPVRELGAGRFATSWLARDPEGRPVVLKLLRRYASDPTSVQQFLLEAQRIAASPELVHPNVARLLNGGVHLVQALFLVYDDGGETTLAEELRVHGRLAAPRALDVCAQLAEGLAALHREGIAHLDLKPSNVGLRKPGAADEEAVLLDFATTHLLSTAGIHDPEPLPISTAGYLAPEPHPDGRADVYALGALLFQLVSGRLPIPGATAAELLAAHRDQPATLLRDLGLRAHEDLERILQRLLAKAPAARPTIDEVPILLRAIAGVAEVTAKDPAKPFPAAPPPSGPVEPPQLLEREPIDPALERALMGDVGPQQAERAPGLPRWAPRVWPKWVRPAAAGAAVVALTLLIAFWPARKPAPPPEPPRRARAKPAPVAPVETPPPAPAPEPQKSAYAKTLDRAQNALWAGRARTAESIVRKDVLGKPDLAPADKARAQKLLGDAAMKRGNKALAAKWYRRAMRSTDDPAYRARIQEALAAAR